MVETDYVDDTMSAQRREILDKLSDDDVVVDFNGLSATGKQAALSLSELGEVVIDRSGQRPMIRRRKRRPLTSGLVSFLTVGIIR